MPKKKKNKKKGSDGIMFPAPLAAILVVAGMLSLTYLWLANRCDAIGRNIKTLERDYTELRRRVMNEEYKWSNMKSPRNIERLLEMHGLEMRWPDERDVVRIHMSGQGKGWLASGQRAEQYALRTGNTMND